MTNTDRQDGRDTTSSAELSELYGNIARKSGSYRFVKKEATGFSAVACSTAR